MRRFIKLLTLSLLAVAAIALAAAAPSLAASTSEITVYRDPSCGCCGGWIAYLTKQGFQPKQITTSNIDALKQQHGVPNHLASCHTATIQGYAIEGHVPAEDIKHLLAQRPKVAGIAVPGMPIGTPGMEDGDRKEPFTVVSFDEQGNTRAFNHYAF